MDCQPFIFVTSLGIQIPEIVTALGIELSQPSAVTRGYSSKKGLTGQGQFLLERCLEEVVGGPPHFQHG